MSNGSDAASELRAFRGVLHACLRRRADALFELVDAILASGGLQSPPHLSLASVHRRGWDSLYAALSQGSVDEEPPRDLLARYPLTKSGNGAEPRVWAVDQSAWPRCDAEASPTRRRRQRRGHRADKGFGESSPPSGCRWQRRTAICLRRRLRSGQAPAQSRKSPHPDSGQAAPHSDLLRRPADSRTPLRRTPFHAWQEARPQEPGDLARTVRGAHLRRHRLR